MDTMIKDEDGFKVFRNYLKSQHCDENIDFWKAVENYRSNCYKEELEKQANIIFKTYITNNSRRCVNLKAPTRSKIGLDIKAKPTRYIFDEAQKEIIQFMQRDPYQRFLKSDDYQNLLI